MHLRLHSSSALGYAVWKLTPLSCTAQHLSPPDTLSSAGKHFQSSVFPTLSNAHQKPNRQCSFRGNLTLCITHIRQICHPPLRLPGVAPVLFWPDSEAALFYRIRPPSDETTPLSHIRGPCPPSMGQGAFSHRTGIIGPSSLRIRVHAGQQVICDDTYSNKSWSIVAKGVFQLREINQVERCQYLEWELNIDLAMLKEFEDMVREDFAGPGPYPTYILPSTKKSTPPPAALPFATPTCGLTPSPSNKQRYSPPNAQYVPSLPSLPSFNSPPETPSSKTWYARILQAPALIQLILPPTKKSTPPPSALPFAAPTCGLTLTVRALIALTALIQLAHRDSLFEDMVRKGFAGPGPYPTYILPPTKKSTPPPSALPFAAPTCGLTPTVRALIALTALIQLAPRDSLFEDMVRKGFAGPCPYPTYILPPTKKSTPPPSALPFAAPTCGLTPSPSNEQWYSPSNAQYVPSLPSLPSFNSPPETPSPSYSTLSPTSSASPPTPIGIEDLSAKIVSASSLPGYSKLSEHIHAPPTKSKMFAFAHLSLVSCI